MVKRMKNQSGICTTEEGQLPQPVAVVTGHN